MTTIRPPAFPPIRTPEPPKGDTAKLAAQRAFFQAALGGAAPAPQAPPTASAASVAPKPVAAPVSTLKTPDLSAEKPEKILRPGSLLDIRV